MLNPQPIFRFVGHVREMQRHHQHVGNALGAFALEMMFRHPERVVAVAVHQHRHRLRLLQRGGEMLVGIQPIVDRRARVTNVVEIDMARVQAVEFRDHAVVLLVLAGMVVSHARLATRGGQRSIPPWPTADGACRADIASRQQKRSFHDAQAQRPEIHARR